VAEAHCSVTVIRLPERREADERQPLPERDAAPA